MVWLFTLDKNVKTSVFAKINALHYYYKYRKKAKNYYRFNVVFSPYFDFWILVAEEKEE